jgi:hypothetical protein
MFKKILKVLCSLVLVINASGCLIGNKLSYKIVLDSQNSGTATVKYYHIRTDADTKDRFEEDKYLLYEYLAKSKQFLDDMKKEGKEILERKLYLNEEGKLNGEATYKFKSLNAVENLVYEDGFYFITLTPEDSVLSTNGQLIKSSTYQRILWDKSYKVLEFQILTEPPAGKYTDMARFYKNYY